MLYQRLKKSGIGALILETLFFRSNLKTGKGIEKLKRACKSIPIYVAFFKFHQNQSGRGFILVGHRLFSLAF